MGMGEAVKSVFSKYATFSGRACRSEYWWFVLFNMIVSIVIAIVEPRSFASLSEFNGPISILYSLAAFLPSIAVSVRRLHDVGRSGWWMFIMLIPLLGAIIYIYWAATRGQDGPNIYGPDPFGDQSNGLTSIPRIPPR